MRLRRLHVACNLPRQRDPLDHRAEVADHVVPTQQRVVRRLHRVAHERERADGFLHEWDRAKTLAAAQNVPRRERAVRGTEEDRRRVEHE